MGAKYESDKPDGYLKIRNEIYRDRVKKLQVRDMQAQAALRNLPEQSKENYGDEDYK